MLSIIQTVISALALLGIGGIVGGYITYVLDKKKERASKTLELKERRYKSSLLYMDAFFDPKNIKYLSSRQPDIHSAGDVLEYLKMECHEMMLYAPPKVIFAVKTFIEGPTRERFLEAILAMREDLSSQKVDIEVRELKL